jgi:hypothetical protein
MIDGHIKKMGLTYQPVLLLGSILLPHLRGLTSNLPPPISQLQTSNILKLIQAKYFQPSTGSSLIVGFFFLLNSLTATTFFPSF